MSKGEGFGWLAADAEKPKLFVGYVRIGADAALLGLGLHVKRLPQKNSTGSPAPPSQPK